jgi:hypothetical protein
VPLATGLCRPGECGTPQEWWGLIYSVLVVVAGGLAVRSLARRKRPTGADEHRIRQLARLALVAAAALTIVFYVRSPAAAVTPIESARYLSCLQISTAAALWPLWKPAAKLWSGARMRWSGARPYRPGIAVGVGSTALLTGMVAVMVAANAALIDRMPAYDDADRQVRAVTARLERLGVSHAYSEYWTCNRITFNSAERVVCAALGEGLRAGQDRYEPYTGEVAADPDPAYVASAGSWLDTALKAHFHDHGIAPTVTEVDAYRIYRTPGRAGLPLS